MSAQRKYLEILLGQWERALEHNNHNDSNEVHVTGDMNLDALDDRWLNKNYHLYSLSTMVQNACHLGNFSQLVMSPTRFQHNSVKNVVEKSCIDHVY